LSLFLIKFCVIQTATNPTSRSGAQNCALGVLFCAWIASGVVFAYAKSEKSYVGGRGRSNFEQFQVLTISFFLTFGKSDLTIFLCCENVYSMLLLLEEDYSTDIRE